MFQPAQSVEIILKVGTPTNHIAFISIYIAHTRVLQLIRKCMLTTSKNVSQMMPVSLVSLFLQKEVL